MNKRTHSKQGWRVRCLPFGPMAKLIRDEYGTFVEKKSNQPAWPYVIRLDKTGENVELDEYQFEWIGPPEPGTVPTAAVKATGPSEGEAVKRVAVKAKEAPAPKAKTKRVAVTTREPLRTKREPVKARGVKREPIRKEPVKAKPKARAKLKMPWTEAILKVINGRTEVKLGDIYAGVRKLIGEPNANFTATVRQSLQSMARQKRTHMVRAGVWGVPKAKPAKAKAKKKA